MKKFFTLIIISFFFFTSCKKESTTDHNNIVSDSTVVTDSTSDFVIYTIQKGEQYCDKNYFKLVDYTELQFIVRFDSSAIYTTVDPSNQYDINKLYGFSDNNAEHQQFSARFGWRWSDNALRLFGYIYINGIRQSKELGTIGIGSENNCSIKVKADHYIFSLNNAIDSLPRKTITPHGVGYKLYPYFGGNETAPHKITIAIKELNQLVSRK